MPGRKHSEHQRAEQIQERRLRLATEAARLLARLRLQDYGEAKRRAAHNLGIDDRPSWPTDALVLERLLEYQRLFGGGELPAQLQKRREAAAQAMERFAAFEPRLVGRVLDGSADEHTPVQLQVFSDEPEAFARLLMDSGLPARALPWQELELGQGRDARVPAWGFLAGDMEFEVAVLPLNLLRQPPLDGDGKPMERAALPALRRLLAP
jgi:hypothetical protein